MLGRFPAVVFMFIGVHTIAAQEKPVSLTEQPANTWIKRSPLKDAPLSPMLGYEGSFGYDPKAKLLIRWAGHNQGGGGEQNAETWTFDLATAKWTLMEPNTSPPGACCNAQNVFDPVGGRFLRFPAFSGSHGWHWFRENYLSNSSVWTYDLPSNTWRDMRPVPTLHPKPLRCASWDSDHQVAVIFGGEGSNDGTTVYDPYDNSWKRMFAANEPKPRSAGNMAYHQKLKRHILFGSQFSDDAHTWAYDLVRNEWTDLQPAQQPPTDKNDAVLAYDERSRVIVASIRAAAKPGADDGWHYETWAYLHDENTWKKMIPNVEPPGGGQRRRIMAAIPDQNVILMENYVNPPQKIPGVEREQQIWTYRYDALRPLQVANPPISLRLEVMPGSALLRWDGSPTSQWHIKRERGNTAWTPTEVKSFVLRGDEKAPKMYLDETLEKGETYRYSIVATDAQGKSSAPTQKVRTQPRLIENVSASVHSVTKVTLAWPHAKEVDVIGYYVERAPVEVFSEDQIVRLRTDTKPLNPPAVGAIKSIGKFEKLNKKPIEKNTYTDIDLDLSKPGAVKDETYRHRFASSQIYDDGKPYRYAVYAYRVRAVNILGVESGGGPYALSIPSSPKGLFSKEEKTLCHLKWEKNPEHGITGYRVYRMESPRINGPGQPVTRVTPELINKNTYRDENVNKDTRRYWIVAVDALGQEGYPSAPTWFERQYKKHYEQFSGEWHQ